MSTAAVASLQSLTQHTPADDNERKELYEAALKVMQNVETPQDTAQRLYHGHLPLATAQTGMDLNLFKFLHDNENKSFSTQELANVTNAEVPLLHRLLRFYAAHGMVKQVDTDTFCASNITHNLALPGTEAGIKHYSLTMTPAYNAIPKFLAKNSYQNPVDSAPFNLAYNTDMPVFKWRDHNPENKKAGQAFMAAQRIGQRSVWDGLVPLDDFKLTQQEIDDGRVLICDVGGGSGHQCVEFRKHQPDIKGRVVTEDLGNVQELVSNHNELRKLDIELVPYDFMKEQPIKDAKVYYMRNVIHNWNDEPSKVILSQTAKAMAPDSVVIIDDVLMPTVGASWKQSSMDLAMMTMLAAMERTKEHFAQLLQASGLKLRNVETYDKDYGDSFIIAVPDPQASSGAEASGSA